MPCSSPTNIIIVELLSWKSNHHSTAGGLSGQTKVVILLPLWPVITRFQAVVGHFIYFIEIQFAANVIAQFYTHWSLQHFTGMTISWQLKARLFKKVYFVCCLVACKLKTTNKDLGECSRANDFSLWRPLATLVPSSTTVVPAEMTSAPPPCNLSTPWWPVVDCFEFRYLHNCSVTCISQQRTYTQ